MTVTRNAHGEWVVTSGKNGIAGPFETMAQAWRWIDRCEGAAISRAEEVSAWVWAKESDR